MPIQPPPSVQSLSGLLDYDPALIPRNLIITEPPVILSWDAPLSGTWDGYIVWRAFDTDQQFHPLNITVTTGYTDNQTELNRFYCYRVTAYSGARNDPNYTPQNLVVILDTGNSPSQNSILVWNPPANQVSGYRVYKNSHWDDLYVPIGDTVDLIYVDSGIVPNIPNYYQIRSVY